MGQHKHNPIAIAAKNGELPPKKKKLTKRQRDAIIQNYIEERTGLPGLAKAMGNETVCTKVKIKGKLSSLFGDIDTTQVDLEKELVGKVIVRENADGDYENVGTIISVDLEKDEYLAEIECLEEKDEAMSIIYGEQEV